jgi:signal transduction histidine kinase
MSATVTRIGSVPHGASTSAPSRRRPRLRTVLVAVNLVILALPLGGVTVLRLYESALVRQTESELLGQAAFLASVYKAALLRGLRRFPARASEYGVPIASEWLPAEGRWQPRTAVLDLAADAVYPRPPDAAPSTEPADPAAVAAGGEIEPVMREAQLATLAAMRVVDARGTVVASSGEDLGRSLADREEVARALRGEPVSLLRERVSDEPTPLLDSVSRGTRLRVFVAVPVVYDWRAVGAVLLSRSPRSIGQTLYGKRYHLLAGGVLLLLVVVVMSVFTSRTVSRPLEALVVQSERAARGERGAVAPLERPITREMAQLSEALARMACTLEERAEYIRGFAARVSHEFKTPLTAIQGAVELLREHGDGMSEERRRRFLDNLAADAKRLERLVVRLLELARADVASGAEQSASLPAVLDRVAVRYRELGLDVRSECPADVGAVAIGEETLDSILSNLLDNVRQHGGGGPVKIRARRIDDEQAAAVVADEGPGISPANAARIFDPFFTTARDRGGTGLGLSIVRALLAAQGGSIALLPTARGAAFEMRLPLPSSQPA